MIDQDTRPTEYVCPTCDGFGYRPKRDGESYLPSNDDHPGPRGPMRHCERCDGSGRLPVEDDR